MTGTSTGFLGKDNFSLTQLRYFCSAAKFGSLAGAAMERHVSATAIAAAIDALEQAFDAQLCVRRKARGIELTPTGRILYEEALLLLRDASHLGQRIRATSTELTGTLRVGCFSNLSTLLVPNLLAAFGAAHPKAALRFTIELNARLLDAMRLSDVDCVITYENLVSDGVTTRRLLTMAPFVAVGPGHHLAHRRRLTLADLQDEPMVLFQSPEALDHPTPMFGPHPLPFQIRFRSSQLDLVRALVNTGPGFTLTLEPVDAPHARAGGNVMIPLEVPWPREHVVLAWSRATRPYPQLNAFIRLATALVDEGKLLPST